METHNDNNFYERYAASMKQMKQAAPELAKGFGGMYAALMRPGALDVREKELIALAIGLAVRCEGCIWAHVEKCLKAGATPEQVLDAAAVAVMMQGGPTYTYVPKVVEALDHFAAAAATAATTSA
jgi:AhpD family alkylhydroperoxidase